MPWPIGWTGIGLAVLVGRLTSWIGGRRWFPLGLGAAYASGHAAARGWLGAVRMPVPPVDALDWIAWLALAVAAWGWMESREFVSRRWRWPGRVVLTGALLALVLGPLAHNDWPMPVLIGGLIGPGLGILAAWGLLNALAERLPGGMLTTLLAMVAGGSSLVLALTGSLVLGELASVLAASIVVSRIGLGRDPGLAANRGVVSVVVVVLAGLLLVGRFYSETPTSTVLLLTVAPLAAWFDQPSSVLHLPAWVWTLTRGLAVLTLTGLAIAIALATGPGNALG